jgi:hypothetical protein
VLGLGLGLGLWLGLGLDEDRAAMTFFARLTRWAVAREGWLLEREEHRTVLLYTSGRLPWRVGC